MNKKEWEKAHVRVSLTRGIYKILKKICKCENMKPGKLLGKIIMEYYVQEHLKCCQQNQVVEE